MPDTGLGQQRPFRFGVMSRGAATRRDWVDKVKRIEALGYASLTVPDHFVRGLAPAVLLTAAAMVSESLRLGTLVYANDFRHPAVLAKEVATLDVLSGGRVDLGIGAGWLKHEYEATGIPFDPVGIRFERMVEAIHLMKRLFVEDDVTFDGRHYQIRNLTQPPKSVQRPHPPIVIGGGGPRLLSIAAREADVISFTTRALPDGTKDTRDLTADATARKIGIVREAAGDRMARIELNVLLADVVPTEDVEGEAERIAGQSGMSPHEVLGAPIYLVGNTDRMVETLIERRDRFGFSYVVVFEDRIEELAPVVARLAGR